MVFILSRLYFRRIRFLFVISILFFIILGGRLYQIQFLQRERLTALVNKIRSEFIPGEEFFRGNILDRNKINLLDSGERPAVAIFPSIFPEKQSLLLSEILHIPITKISTKLETAKSYYASNPFIIKTNLTSTEFERLENEKLQGVYIAQINCRYGPESKAVHLIGHIGPIDQNIWENLQKLGKTAGSDKAYKKDDVIGVKGIEAIYEEYLRNVRPNYYLKATVDAYGKPLLGLGFNKIINKSEESNRYNVILTIDNRIQKIVEEIMDKQVFKGAVVILDCITGEVLALASRPDFDQNMISKYVQKSSQSEFINRAMVHYYPGSVFKVIIAAAAMEEGLVNLDEKFECTGEFKFESGLIIPCWKKDGHGKIFFKEALAHSCNPVFIELGMRLGESKILEYAKKFGLNQDDILGYPLQNHSLLKIDKNSSGAIGNAAIGQQGIRLSPIQVAKMYAVIANDGVYNQPSVVLRIEDNKNHIVKKFIQKQGVQIISPKTAKNLQEMLKLATTVGTAKKAWVHKCGSAGKTSTAQTGEQNEVGKEKINAWFAGFAPYENPKYAVAIIVEDGTTGGKDAAPIFKEIIEKIYNY